MTQERAKRKPPRKRCAGAGSAVRLPSLGAFAKNDIGLGLLYRVRRGKGGRRLCFCPAGIQHLVIPIGGHLPDLGNNAACPGRNQADPR